MAHPHWPLFDLRVRTPRLELRIVDEELADELVDLASAGIHPPEFMPFTIPWTDDPDGVRQQRSLQHYWRVRADLQPASWILEFAVLMDGVAVGSQGVGGTQFRERRVATTGSWIGLAHQGSGIGKEMRSAVVHLAFVGLGAQRCESGAWHDNGASLGVSRALGYEDNGDEVALRRGVADRLVRVKLDRAVWEQRRRDDIVIEGLEPCLALLGLRPGDAPG